MIDIGSNTMRLVIYELKNEKSIRQIENVKVVARLRNYLDKNEILTKKGIEILLDTLKSFQVLTKHHALEKVNCIATATIRQAKNKQTIMEIVEKETDFTMTVFSEYEEAYYGFLAVIHSTSITEGVTIDIGGGSTEVTYFQNRELVEYHSFPFGALSLKLQFVKNHIPTPKEREQIEAYILSQFNSLPWLRHINVPIVAIGGSARNMVQLHQNLIDYPLAGVHQYEMSHDDICQVKEHLDLLPYQEIQKLDGLSKDRADTIVPAIQVFHTLCEVTDSKTFILSRKGLREGVFFGEVIKRHEDVLLTDVLAKSLRELMEDYEMDEEHVKQMSELSPILFQHIRSSHSTCLQDEDLNLLKRAAQVFYLGEYIDAESSSQHTFYLLANRTIDGLNHKERLKLALVASYKGKSTFKQYIAPFKEWFTKEEYKRLLIVGSILKFTHSLNATKRNVVNQLEVKIQEGQLFLTAQCHEDYRAEEYQTEKQKKQLEKVLKLSVHLRFTLI
ncbi:Ppx/GppA family phosphatase [Bacillus sp. CGMCC 1.16541]|uniref:Ppx/GppA family phosphatase n=1 Tax=Bacillus sp. CGMCC 1.16541 TaxID=2185143 RepID=UPI000D735CEC|nr:Ppx/GppA family phosphatase [Bacillus sp. CGMCC 1.16541]